MSALNPVSTYPLSPFQERICLLPVTCKISKAAFEKFKELKTFQIWMSMDLGRGKEVKLFYVDSSFSLRLRCYYEMPRHKLEKEVVEPVAPALCRGYDEACEQLVLRTPGKWYEVSGERVIVCKSDVNFKHLKGIRTVFVYSFGDQRKEVPFTINPVRKTLCEDSLTLSIDFKNDQWELGSEFLEHSQVEMKEPPDRPF
jgi:hypothetical protein